MSRAEGDNEPVLFGFDALASLIADVFVAHGCSRDTAGLIGANMALAERDGAHSHGIFRIPAYLSSLASGWVDGEAVPSVEDVGPALLRADAMNGFALSAHAVARPLLVARARENGVAILAIRNSHHFSALWPDVEPYAHDGLVALTMVNSMATVIAFDGREPVFGTDPIAFAAPRAGTDALVFDLATSALSNGDVQIAAREKRTLPPGSGVDGQRRPTTDPEAVLDGGALLAFGGYKGSAIALMIEVMAAALTGGKFSFEVDWSAHPGARTPHTGQFLMLIDPSRGATRDFAARVETLLSRLGETGVTRLPGDRRYANRRRAEREGIPIWPDDLDRLRKLAGTTG